jgi:monoamine oxidase
MTYLRSKGMNGWLLSLFNVAFTTEYGLEASEQSALNMLLLLDTALPGCSLFGPSDERFKIAGGNQRVTDELADRVGDINFQYEVKSIRDAGSGYRVYFTNGEKVKADYIICTIPFSVLREIDLDLKEMSEVKRKCIRELGYGRNAKTFVGYNKNIWRKNGFLGEIFTDRNFQLGWEHSHLQNTRTFGYTFFTGGIESDAAKDLSLDEKVKKYTAQMDEVFTGSMNELNGRQGQFYWPSFPYAKASYACYRVGQWCSIAGAESDAVGNILFAGEHCSFNFQGFMNGGAETGRVAAENLIRVLK